MATKLDDPEIIQLKKEIFDKIKQLHDKFCGDTPSERMVFGFIERTKDWTLHRHCVVEGKEFEVEDKILSSLLIGMLFPYGMREMNIGVAQNYLMRVQAEHYTDDLMKQSSKNMEYHRSDEPDNSVR